MPELLHLRASHGRRYVVEAGVLDDRALLAFGMGQCHSMALALQRATGGALVGLTEQQTPFDHVLVRIGEARLIDVGGARPAAELTASGGRLTDIDADTVVALSTDHGWEPPQPDLAALWTDAVLGAVERGDPHREPTCFTYDFALDGILDIHVEWSYVDTGERLTAFGRRPGDATGRWVRCGVHSIKPDASGLRIIDFAPGAFRRHSRRMEELLRASSDAVMARFLEAADQQQPLRVP